MNPEVSLLCLCDLRQHGLPHCRLAVHWIDFPAYFAFFKTPRGETIPASEGISFRAVIFDPLDIGQEVLSSSEKNFGQHPCP